MPFSGVAYARSRFAAQVTSGHPSTFAETRHGLVSRSQKRSIDEHFERRHQSTRTVPNGGRMTSCKWVQPLCVTVCSSTSRRGLLPWRSPIPIILWGPFLFQSRISPICGVRERASLINSQYGEQSFRYETVKSFTAEEREVETLDRLSVEYKEGQRRCYSTVFSVLSTDSDGDCAWLWRHVDYGENTLDGQMETGIPYWYF